MPHYCYTFFIAFCINVFVSVITPAAASEICPHPAFGVTGVEISASASTGEEARRIATAEGLEQAWRILKERLLAEEKISTDDDISGLIDYVRIASETVLSKRYIAQLDYCFDREKTRAWFAARQLRHAELVSAPMLVLPIWNEAGARIFRRPNPWGDAWAELLSVRDGLVTLKIVSSIATERAIKPEAVKSGVRDEIARIAKFESVENVIVSIVTPKVKGNMITVNATAALYGADGVLESVFYNIDDLSFPRTDTNETLRQLAGEIETGLDKVWHDVNVVALEEAGEVVLYIPAESISVWHSRIEALKSLAVVENVRILRINYGGGLVSLKLTGSVQSLLYALLPSSLVIEESRGEDGEVTFHLISRE